MGILRTLSDRSFEGVIESAEFRVERSAKRLEFGEDSYMVVRVRLAQRNGDVFDYEKRAQSSSEDMRPVYREGWTLRHVAGAPYDQSFPSEDAPRVRCVLCGTDNRRVDHGCAACGCSLPHRLPRKERHNP
jgi:hypothetical protein